MPAEARAFCTIPEYQVPKVQGPNEVDSVWSAYDRIIHLFEDRAPSTYISHNRKGEAVMKVTKTGYAMVWIPEYREAGKRVFKIGIRAKYKQALTDAYKACGYRADSNEGGPYIVDLDNRTCNHYAGTPCPAWKCSNNRWCSHQIGAAHWLTRPYVIGTNTGIIYFEEGK